MSETNNGESLPSNGAINLDELSDVDVTSILPVDGDILAYSNNLWKPKKINSNSYVIELAKWGITKGLPSKRIENINGRDITCYSKEAYSNAYNNIIGINNAFAWAYANGYNEVKMPLGEYAVCYATVSNNDKENYLVIDYNNFTFDMGGSTFKVIYDSEKRSPYHKKLVSGSWVESTDPIYNFANFFLKIRDCTYSCVRNGKVIGDKIDRSFKVQEEKAVEWSYGIGSGGNCKYILIENIDIAFFMGDGLTGSVGLGNTQAGVGYNMGWQLGSLDNNGAFVASTTECVSKFVTIQSSTPHHFVGYGYSQGLTYLKNKKYKVYCYDANKNFIVKKDSYVLREFITTKNTKYVRFVVEENTVDVNGWSMELRKGIYGSYVIYRNNYIHHNHRGGITIGVNDMYIMNNHFYENGPYPDYDNDLPGFEQGSGVPFMTRYHINMEDNQGFNINIIGNTFEGGRLGIAARGWDYTIQNNYFKNTGVMLYRLRYLVLTDNYFENGSIETFAYNEDGSYYRHWNIENNTIDGNINIYGTAPIDTIVGNTITGSCTVPGRVTSFKNNAFELNKTTSSLTLGSVGVIDSCSFIKSSTSTVLNSISFGNIVVNNCIFEHIKIGVNNTVMCNSKFKNSGIQVTNNVKLENCTVTHGDFTLLNMYSYSGNSAFLQMLNTTTVSNIEIINCNIISSSPNQIIYCSVKIPENTNNINVKIENTKIVKQLNIALGLDTVKGTISLINSDISSELVISAYQPNLNLTHTFIDNKLTNVSFNIKSGDITGTKYNYSMKGSTYPTSGFYSLGQLIYNSNPVSGGTIGWICTVEGIASNIEWTSKVSYPLGKRIFNGTHVYEVISSGYSLLTPPKLPISSGASITEDRSSLPVWQSDKSYVIGDLVIQATGNNGLIYKCTVSGKSGTTEPIWPADGISVNDGTARWIGARIVTWKEIGIKAEFKPFGLISE